MNGFSIPTFFESSFSFVCALLKGPLKTRFWLKLSRNDGHFNCPYTTFNVSFLGVCVCNMDWKDDLTQSLVSAGIEK